MPANRMNRDEFYAAPGRRAYLDFAVKVGAELPSRAREISAERARAAKHVATS